MKIKTKLTTSMLETFVKKANQLLVLHERGVLQDSYSEQEIEQITEIVVNFLDVYNDF